MQLKLTLEKNVRTKTKGMLRIMSVKQKGEKTNIFTMEHHKEKKVKN